MLSTLSALTGRVSREAMCGSGGGDTDESDDNSDGVVAADGDKNSSAPDDACIIEATGITTA